MERNYCEDLAGDPIFASGSVSQAINRVKSCLNYALKEKYGIEDKDTTDKFLKMHGLSAEHFDFINNFEALVEKGIADNSVDANANKGEKSISGYFVEAALPINKLVGYRYLYRKMKDMYGKNRAKFLAGEMYDMSLALADSTNILKPYCFSINASKLVIEGRPWGALPSAPPKRLDSYVHCLSEVVHQLSNHTAGAIAVGSFFLDLAHMFVYRDHKTLTDLASEDCKKEIENSLQSFIHSMNHLSRNSVESPFTNISIFDRPKLLALIADDNMGWYFEKEDPIDGAPTRALEDCGDQDWKEYIIKIILELEDIYMNIMDAGDKCHDGRPITFPVSTVNISRKQNRLGNYEFADREFVDYVCKNHDIMRYNIYTSDGAKVASCCFSGDQLFTYFEEDGTQVFVSFEDFAKEYLTDGKTETKIENSKKYVKDPESGELKPITGVIKLENMYKELITFEFENGVKIKATPNQKFFDNNTKTMVMAKDIVKDPELIKGMQIVNYCVEKTDEPVYDIEVDTKDHTFNILDDHRVSNCRLINDSDLFELGGQVNSFGGTALSLGSHRVVTVNLRRIMLECDSWEDYKNRLWKRMDSAADILKAHKELIKDMTARGTQPFIDNGWLSLDKMFSTFGIMGYYEAAQDAKLRFGGDFDYIGDLIKTIDQYSREFTKSKGIITNVEEIPGENMAAKLANTDRWLFGEEKVTEPLYANQFIPLWEDATLHEKFTEEGRLSKMLTGGGICHYSIGEKITGAQARNVIEEALKCGMEHFALNPTYSICENDHFTFGKHDICPICLGRTVDNFSRTVGFFIRTSNMTTVKRKHDFEKRHYGSI